MTTQRAKRRKTARTRHDQQHADHESILLERRAWQAYEAAHERRQNRLRTAARWAASAGRVTVVLGMMTMFIMVGYMTVPH